MNFDGFGGEDARNVHYISANAQMLRVWGGYGAGSPSSGVRYLLLDFLRAAQLRAGGRLTASSEALSFVCAWGAGCSLL